MLINVRTPGVPRVIAVRGARVHNLRNIDVDVPLQSLVAIAGVSGSGKSSVAMGVLYAEGSRRYVEALATYTRRRMTHAARAAVDSVRHVPAALALRQRPGVPGPRSTFGTATELLNVLRVMFSRLGAHLCPNGHRQPPTIDVAAGKNLRCLECGAEFAPPGAEDFAFNSSGACPACAGTGIVTEIDDDALVPDPAQTIADGAVAPWRMFGLTVMPQVVAAMGVRIDIPYAELADAERDIVLRGPEEKRHIRVPSNSGKLFDLDFTYRNARLAVSEAMHNATSEKGISRVARFVTTATCPGCLGTRLSSRARGSRVAGIDLAQVSAMALDEVLAWAPTVINTLPPDLIPVAELIISQLAEMAQRLIQLGLGYLWLDRPSATLSTGERQRVQLARAVRSETTGVLYVLDEPSIGLHPANLAGLVGVMRDLLRDGNSVILVDHDVQVLREADWMIEIGPGSGSDGGLIVSQGTIDQIVADPESIIGPFLDDRPTVIIRERTPSAAIFAHGTVRLSTAPIHTVHALEVSIPQNRLTAVTGLSGSGKSTLVLKTLVPALAAATAGTPLPHQVVALDPGDITTTQVVDATPIGVNQRSTVATYSGVLGELRKAVAATDAARRHGLKAADFSYNTGSLKCPRCAGTGQVVLDVQFLPDVDIPCPDCGGSRYAPQAEKFGLDTTIGRLSLPDLLGLSVRRAHDVLDRLPKARALLADLIDLGLGYLTLGENTPALSGGEAQRLKLAAELDRKQHDNLFVFDEPSVGLHPLDLRVLINVFDQLLANGATIVVIEHDLDLMVNADYLIDMGPGGGSAGGRIVATGTPEQIAANPDSVTGTYLSVRLDASGGLAGQERPGR